MPGHGSLEVVVVVRIRRVADVLRRPSTQVVARQSEHVREERRQRSENPLVAHPHRVADHLLRRSPRRYLHLLDSLQILPHNDLNAARLIRRVETPRNIPQKPSGFNWENPPKNPPQNSSNVTFLFANNEMFLELLMYEFAHFVDIYLIWTISKVHQVGPFKKTGLV